MTRYLIASSDVDELAVWARLYEGIGNEGDFKADEAAADEHASRYRDATGREAGVYRVTIERVR
jgi:hypothetical protein